VPESAGGDVKEKMQRRILKRPDIILAKLREGFRWAEENIQAIVLMGGGIFVSAALGIAVNTWLGQKQTKASITFYEADKAFNQKVLEYLEKKREGEDLTVVLQTELIGLHEVAKAHPKSEAAFLGYLKLGDIYTAENHYEKAREFYEKALHNTTKPFYRVLAYYNLGYVHELLGDCQRGIDSFQKVAAFNKTRILFWSFGYRPNAFWLSSAYFGIGRCHEKLNQFKEAREAYLRVIDEFSQTPFSDKADAIVLLLDSKIGLQ